MTPHKSECCERCKKWMGKVPNHKTTCLQCSCHSQAHYVDSLTPEERKEQEELQKTAVTSTASQAQRGTNTTFRKIEPWEKAFEKTMLITKAGAWLECSDYEGTVDDMRHFIHQTIEEAVKEERKRIADALPEAWTISENGWTDDSEPYRKLAETYANTKLEEIRSLLSPHGKEEETK